MAGKSLELLKDQTNPKIAMLKAKIFEYKNEFDKCLEIFE